MNVYTFSFSVLVNYHNKLLELIRGEMNDNSDHFSLSPLKHIVNELSQREISILQITQENMGVITLNEMDCQWIERLARASLENEKDYFLKLNMPLKFNFLYIQSYLIRTYLLYCRINYEHIKEKYQCNTRPKIMITTNDLENDDLVDKNLDIRLVNEWKHLEQKNLEQLKTELNFLQRIMNSLISSSDDHSSMKLSEFIQNINYDDRIAQQFVEYEIKDFSLAQIKDVYRLYKQFINQSQHAFINVSHLICVPLDTKLDDELNQILRLSLFPSNDQAQKENFQVNIRMITELLDDLKIVEDQFITQSAKSFVETCIPLEITNRIVSLIPREIKCENYVPLCLKLIEIRSHLQEQMLNIQEQTTNLWSIHFDVPNISDTNQLTENSFQVFRNKDEDILDFKQNLDTIPDSQMLTTPEPSSNANIDQFDWWQLIDGSTAPTEPLKSEDVSSSAFVEGTMNYTSLFQLTISPISLPVSVLFENCRTEIERLKSKSSNMRFVIKFKDNKQEKYHCRPEKFYTRLEKIFNEQQYDLNTMSIIDANQISIDFIKVNRNNSLPIIEAEYGVIEKNLLISVILDFENNQIEYFTGVEARISSILGRFIFDQQLNFISSENYFSIFDSLGRYIAEDCQINHIYRSDEQSSIYIRVLSCKQNANICSEISLTVNQGTSFIEIITSAIYILSFFLEITKRQYFHPTTTWKQIDIWLKNLGIITETPTHSYYFWHTEQKQIIDENEMISLTLGQMKSIDVDVLGADNVIDIILTYDQTSQMIHILKSCPIQNLLNNPKYSKQFDLKILPQHRTLIFVSNEQEKQILNDFDMQNPIGHYASMTDKVVHFQISILIKIILYDNEKEIPITVSHRNMTIKELLEMIKINDGYKYLASYETKSILCENIQLSTINEMKFFLAKEHQTCLISIRPSEDILIVVDDENMQNQRYLINATINDIYQRNKNIEQDQYLLYGGDFVPSRELTLSSFLSTKILSIEFCLINRKLEANVTVTKDEQNNSIQFQCDPSMSFDRVHQIACQLWKLNQQLYRLTLSDDSNIDKDDSLNDTGESIDNLQLKLISIADIKCAITYQNRTIVISATNETSSLAIVTEFCEKLLIPIDDVDVFELKLLDDPECPTNVDFDSTIGELRTDFPIESDTLSFRLENRTRQ